MFATAVHAAGLSAALQEAGYLQVDVDPRDRRARIVSPTDNGLRLQRRILEIFADTEERWRQAVGPRNWDNFRKVLSRLAAEK